MFDVVINPAAASGRVKKVWLRTIEPIFQAAHLLLGQTDSGDKIVERLEFK